MDEEELSYKSLRRIQQMEKNSPVLSELSSNFYNAVSEYLEKLEKRFEEESSSQKKMILEDEMKNVKKIIINIYEQREKKILLAAISKARGGNPDLKNLEIIEKNLFDSILDIILQSRKQLLKNEIVKKNVKREIKNTKNSKKNENNVKTDNTNPILRITKNIPEFIGTNEKRYNLRQGDIVSLPENMGKMLIKKDAAKEIEQ